MSQQAIDRSNAEFWDTLCGSNMARQAGITGRDEDDLRRFDDLYFEHYPYLERYVPDSLAGKKVLEVGLGFGTLGQLLASRGADYHGADIAPGPVAMMRQRLEWLGLPTAGVREASVLELPWPESTFDYVYTIGCLHHTGDLLRSVDEVHRVLKPGGRAVVMLYNRHSFRRIAHATLDRLKGMSRRESEDAFRKMYDADEAGTAAPHTDFVSRGDVRCLFGKFERVKIDSQNFDGFRYGIRREWFLNNLGRVVGLDLYIVADKRS
ncbi:MAG: class I SAM-dependent methyltransferase [Actinomycetota bacterium]|nr:class I SAM-dependent methyltransferase [Actinomycetota bacterium]